MKRAVPVIRADISLACRIGKPVVDCEDVLALLRCAFQRVGQQTFVTGGDDEHIQRHIRHNTDKLCLSVGIALAVGSHDNQFDALTIRLRFGARLDQRIEFAVQRFENHADVRSLQFFDGFQILGGQWLTIGRDGFGAAGTAAENTKKRYNPFDPAHVVPSPPVLQSFFFIIPFFSRFINRFARLAEVLQSCYNKDTTCNRKDESP